MLRQKYVNAMKKIFQENKNKVFKIQNYKIKKKESTFEICCSFIDLNKQNFEKVNSFRDSVKNRLRSKPRIIPSACFSFLLFF